MDSIRFTLLVLCLTLIHGCSEQASIENDLKRYHAQLATTIELTSPWLSPQVSLHYPLADQIQHNIASTSIALTQLYQLQDCAVATLIAQRNTALGKVQLPSVRFRYELELLRQLQQCKWQSKDPKRIKQIDHWMAIKQTQLGQVWANMLQSSRETKRLFSHNQAFIHGDSRDKHKQVMQALAYFNQLIADQEVDVSILESQLNLVRQHTLLANSWRTVKLLSAYIERVNDSLDRIVFKGNCGEPGFRQLITQLNAIHQDVFNQQIQPVISQLADYHRQYQEHLENWLSHHFLHPQFNHYLRQRLAEYQTYEQILQRHTSLWQALWGQCQRLD